MPRENYAGRYFMGRDLRELGDELMRMTGKDKLTYPSQECIDALSRWSRDHSEMAGDGGYGLGILILIEIEVQRRLALAKENGDNAGPYNREGFDGDR